MKNIKAFQEKDYSKILHYCAWMWIKSIMSVLFFFTQYVLLSKATLSVHALRSFTVSSDVFFEALAKEEALSEGWSEVGYD